MGRRSSSYGYKTSYQRRKDAKNKKWRRSMGQARDNTAAILAGKGGEDARFFDMFSNMNEQRGILAVYQAEGAVTMGTRPPPGHEALLTNRFRIKKKRGPTMRKRQAQHRGAVDIRGRQAIKAKRRNPTTKATKKARVTTKVAHSERLRQTEITSHEPVKVVKIFRVLRHDAIQLQYEVNQYGSNPDSPSMTRSHMERAHDLIFRFYQECAALHTNHPLSDAACSAVSHMLENNMFNEKLVKEILELYLKVSNR